MERHLWGGREGREGEREGSIKKLDTIVTTDKSQLFHYISYIIAIII